MKVHNIAHARARCHDGRCSACPLAGGVVRGSSTPRCSMEPSSLPAGACLHVIPGYYIIPGHTQLNNPLTTPQLPLVARDNALHQCNPTPLYSPSHLRRLLRGIAVRRKHDVAL